MRKRTPLPGCGKFCHLPLRSTPRLPSSSQKTPKELLEAKAAQEIRRCPSRSHCIRRRRRTVHSRTPSASLTRRHWATHQRHRRECRLAAEAGELARIPGCSVDLLDQVANQAALVSYTRLRMVKKKTTVCRVLQVASSRRSKFNN